jgi:hypothetical protein
VGELALKNRVHPERVMLSNAELELAFSSTVNVSLSTSVARWLAPILRPSTGRKPGVVGSIRPAPGSLGRLNFTPAQSALGALLEVRLRLDRC